MKKLIKVTALMCLAVTAFAQEVQFDYDHSTNFNAYKTYRLIAIPFRSATNSWIKTSSAPSMCNSPGRVCGV